MEDQDKDASIDEMKEDESPFVEDVPIEEVKQVFRKEKEIPVKVDIVSKESSLLVSVFKPPPST